MIDETRAQELTSLFEDAYEDIDTAKDIISGARVTIKEAKVGIKSYSENNKLDPKIVMAVFKDYSSWRDGAIKWGAEQDEKDELLVAVMDIATKDSTDT